MVCLQLRHYLQLAVSPLTLNGCKDLTFSLKNPSNLKCRAVASSFTHLAQVKQPGDNCVQVEGNGLLQGEAHGMVMSGQRVFSHKVLVNSRAESQTCVFASGQHPTDKEVKLHCTLLRVAVFRSMSML